MQTIRAELVARDRDPASFPIAKRVYIAVEDDAAVARRRMAAVLEHLYGTTGLEAVAVTGQPDACIQGVAEVMEAGAGADPAQPAVRRCRADGAPGRRGGSGAHGIGPVKYMVIERYTHGAELVYERFRREGRMLPAGLTFIESWVDESLGTCYQVMETDDRALLDSWTTRWSDLVEFEIVAVISSAEAAARASG